MSKYILAVDQGTSSSKAILLDATAEMVASSDNMPIAAHCPRPGWVEFRPEEMLDSIVRACRAVVEKAGVSPRDIACVGLANQGETVIAFDRDSGAPICPAISWQDKRSLAIIERWRASGKGDFIRDATGLIPDPYFSAPKMRWILENVPEAVRLAGKGALCLATSDAWLLRQLMSEKRVLTDVATASRTMLLNLASLEWDDEMLALCSVPRSALPEVVSNDVIVGKLNKSVLGVEIPLGGLCVDQQAALFGQRCFREGDMKITCGTGCFMLANVGRDAERRAEGLLTSVGWRVRDRATYVFDGGVYGAGSLVKWITDNVKLAASIQDIEAAIADKADANGVYFIPALAGLAAPYWKADMRGSWHGLAMSSDRSDLLRSVMEAIAFRVKDIFHAMESAGAPMDRVRADGGLSQSAVLMQLQADLLNVPIDVFKDFEATAVGAGLLAGMAALGWSPEEKGLPAFEERYRRFEPNRERGEHSRRRYATWKKLLLKEMGEDADGN